jgi:predicted metalloprotease
MVGGGIGSLLLVVVLAVVFGVNPGDLLGPPPNQQGGPPNQQQDDQRTHFIKVVLAQTEDVWGKLFKEMGKEYRKPTLVLYTGETDTACGEGEAAVGPFYCPEDEKLYLDPSFFDEMAQRLGAQGDFAQAYVIAHEIGHHVQKQLGTLDKAHHLQASASSKEEANHVQVRVELQADFYAGVWAHHAQEMRHDMENGDLEEAVNAAKAVGDDRLMRAAGRRVMPEKFTHGTSDQRMRWFKKGFNTGDVRQGDTFNAKDL